MGLFRYLGSKVHAEGVELVTIPNVPIISTGIEYPLGTGPATFTEDDLRDAVRAAEEDPNVQHPRLKLAYGGPHEDAVINEPAFGKVTNLRLGDNDQTIYGDYTGVPKWLAEVLPVAYPSRSVEANRNCETVGGNKYALVINNVSLLGVHLPGVTSLPDLAAYYGAEVPAGTVIDSPIQASVGVEDVRRMYYDELESAGPEYSWWWIRAMELEASGGFLVVDDDEGSLYKVPFVIEGEEVTYADPEVVKIEYVAASATVEEKRQAAQMMVAGLNVSGKATVYASRAESRPSNATKEGGATLELKEAAKRLGLPEDATEEQIYAKMEELNGEAQPGGDDGGEGDGEGEGEGGGVSTEGEEQPKPDPAEDKKEGVQTDDEGFVRLDKDTYEQLAASGAAAQKLVDRTDREHRVHVVNEAVKAGKIVPASRDKFLAAMEADPEGIEKLLTAPADKGGLAAGLVPVREQGTGGGGDGDTDVEGLPNEWFGGAVEAATKRAEKRGPVTMAREA
jgi:hypothetical protein